MSFEHGYLTLGRIRGAPVRVHWSAPVGALLLGQLRFVPGFWLAFFALILAHELGHALFVLASGGRVIGIDVTGMGGQCRYEGSVTPLWRSLIAWGGVVAQLVILAVVGTLLLVLGTPESPFLAELCQTCVSYNLLLIAINLLPFRPLDGYEAWKLFPLLREHRRVPRVDVMPRREPPRADTLPRLGSVELEVERLRQLLERAPRR